MVSLRKFRSSTLIALFMMTVFLPGIAGAQGGTGVIYGTVTGPAGAVIPDCEVTIELPSDRNDEIDALEPGSLVSADCKLLKWNTIYDRLEMRQT